MTNKNRSNLSSRGFTLLEVLIAVLIVGIIATAALPLLSSYTEKAREAREEANMLVKAQAIDRYNMDHQAPLGTVYDPSDSTLVAYGLASMRGPSAQLLVPTDVNGNVMGDPVTANPGTFSYGPYLEQLPPEPASLLAGVVRSRRLPALVSAGAALVVDVSGTTASMSSWQLIVKAFAYKLTDDFGDTGVYSREEGIAALGYMRQGSVPWDGSVIYDFLQTGATSDAQYSSLFTAAATAMADANLLASVNKKWGTTNGDICTALKNATEYYTSLLKLEGEEKDKNADLGAVSRLEHAADFFRKDVTGKSPFAAAVVTEQDWDGIIATKMGIIGPRSTSEAQFFKSVIGHFTPYYAAKHQAMNVAEIGVVEPHQSDFKARARDWQTAEGQSFLLAANAEAKIRGMPGWKDLQALEKDYTGMNQTYLGLDGLVILDTHIQALGTAAGHLGVSITRGQAMGELSAYSDLLAHPAGTFTPPDYEQIKKKPYGDIVLIGDEVSARIRGTDRLALNEAIARKYKWPSTADVKEHLVRDMVTIRDAKRALDSQPGPSYIVTLLTPELLGRGGKYPVKSGTIRDIRAIIGTHSVDRNGFLYLFQRYARQRVREYSAA